MIKRALVMLLCALCLVPGVAQGEFIFVDRTYGGDAAQTEEGAEPAADAGEVYDDTYFADATFTDADAGDTAAAAGAEGWPRRIVVTVGGDTTLGCTDAQRTRAEGFARVIREKGYEWPFSELAKVFGGDDLTLVNFEGTLTESEEKTPGKLFNFKGPAEYAQMLVLGSVEAVNLANNHYIDYGDAGKADTRAALDAHGIVYCASGQTAIYEVRGVRIGLIGNTFPYTDGKRDISKDVQALRDAGCQIVLASFHWGSEYEPYTRDQRNIGRAAVNAGADAVIGHHPHIIQPVEAYEGTYILYSLGNLVFGGNTDPSEKSRDTFVAQLAFTVHEDETVEGPELSLYPMRVTNERSGTDYRPIFVQPGDAYDRIMGKILNHESMKGFENPAQ